MDVPGKKIIWYNLNQIWVRPPAPPIVEDAVLKNFFFVGGGGTFLEKKFGWITSISPSSAMINDHYDSDNDIGGG